MAIFGLFLYRRDSGVFRVTKVFNNDQKSRRHYDWAGD